jgi:hypothetical protein
MVVQQYSVHGGDARVLCEPSELSIGILFRRSNKYPFLPPVVSMHGGWIKIWRPLEYSMCVSGSNTKVQMSSRIVESETLSRFHRTVVSLSLETSSTEHTNICNYLASETDNLSSSAMRSALLGICFGLLRRPRCHPRISVKWAL